MSVSFIHTADWQIGKQFGQIDPEIAAFLRDERFNVIKRIAQLANERQVDGVLVAGDVFDANEVSDTTIRKALNAMQGYKGAWVLLPGNHDPALTDSVWTRINNLSKDEKPENLILALEPKPIFLAKNQLVILPAPLKQRHENEDLTAWFDQYNPPDAGMFKVGLAHGSIKEILPESAERYNMISSQRVETAGLDYLALGDWHGQLRPKSSLRIWYSGTPEQDRFRNNEPGKALLVTLTEKDNDPKIAPLSTGKYQWHHLEKDLFNKQDIDSLQADLTELVPNEDQVIKLNLKGNLSLEDHQQVKELLQRWRAKFKMLDVIQDELKSTPSEEELQALSSIAVLGKTVKKLLAIRDDKENKDQSYAERAIQLLWQEWPAEKKVS